MTSDLPHRPSRPNDATRRVIVMLLDEVDRRGDALRRIAALEYVGFRAAGCIAREALELKP